jgi:hypothetical protein
MRKLLYVSAAMFALFALTPSNSVADDAAAPATPSAAHSHDTGGIGTKGHHPKHGKIHGHSHVTACMKHCDDHHANKGTKDDVADCKKLCHEHHKTKQTTNPSGRKGSGAK